MATITFTIPTGDQTTVLLGIADAYLRSMGIDISGMTPVQRATRWCLEEKRAQYIEAKRQASAVAVQATINAAATQAATDAQQIV